MHGVRLLDDLELSVGVGGRLLLVSRPEGSASLLLRILAGLAHADHGSVRLAGVSRADDSAAGWARRIGYVGASAGIYGWMTPAEVLELAGRLAGYDRADRQRRSDAALERYRLGASRHAPIRRGGAALAQRTALAAAMLTDPEVLLLDDPLRSVEAEERSRLLAIPGKRRTVVLASGFPATEVGLVNQVALLRDGKVALHVPVRELDARGLTLSLRGIEALAGIGEGAGPAAGVAAR
ncbi:MAG: ATP-binding cassette domain-containing protein [Candidatus Limnocylindria bacterium]